MLKISPIGSSVRELVKVLKLSGAVSDTPTNKEDNGGWDYVRVDGRKIKIGNFLSFSYHHNTLTSIYKKNWSVFIEKEGDEIKGIFPTYYQGT